MPNKNVGNILEDASRSLAKEVFKEHYGDKAKPTLWICGQLGISSSEKTNCMECKAVCYYDKKLVALFDKDHEKICTICALKNHKKELSETEIKFLESCFV